MIVITYLVLGINYMNRVTLAFVSCCVFFINIAVADSHVEQRLSQQLLGSWTLPTNDPRYSDKMKVIISYEAEGKGVYKVYSDRNCHELIRQINFTWEVEEGTLYTRTEASPTVKAKMVIDKIVKVDDTEYVLIGPDAIEQHRVRADVCEG